MPIFAGTEPRKRSAEKSRVVLQFLRDTIYSNAETLGLLMQVHDRKAIHRSLMKMEDQGIIRRESIEDVFSKLTLWGITTAGQEAAVDHGESPSFIVFNTSKISRTNLRHYLMLQRIHILATQSGWTEWEYSDRTAKRFARPTNSNGEVRDVRPDATAKTPQGVMVAIEAERMIKATDRYRDLIIPSHLRRIVKGEYQQVIWIAPDKHIQDRLVQTLRVAVADLKQKQQWSERAKFTFTNMTVWPHV